MTPISLPAKGATSVAPFFVLASRRSVLIRKLRSQPFGWILPLNVKYSSFRLAANQSAKSGAIVRIRQGEL